MSVETNSLTATRTILAAIVTALEAVQVSGATAFSSVSHFDLTDWEAAMQRLILSDSPVAFVTWQGDDFENDLGDVVLTTRRSQSVEVLFSDFKLSDPTIALIGDDTQPGTLGLLDAVLPAITGVLIAGTNNVDCVWCEPAGVERLIITQDDQNESPGRNIVSLSLRVRGAYMQVGIGDMSA